MLPRAKIFKFYPQWGIYVFSQVIKYLLIVIFIDFIISQKIRHCFVYYKDDLLQETAINISYACGHLQPDLTVLDLTGLTRQEEDHSPGVQYIVSL